MTISETFVSSPDGTADDVPGAPAPPVRSARDAAQRLKHIASAEQEHFYVLGLDSKHRVIITHCAAIGTADRVVVALRDVFRELVRHNCIDFIVGHNHPSGDSHPSPGDLQLTLDLQLAGKFLGIPHLDHLILARDCFYSIREEALYPLDI